MLPTYESGGRCLSSCAYAVLQSGAVNLAPGMQNRERVRGKANGTSKTPEGLRVDTKPFRALALRVAFGILSVESKPRGLASFLCRDMKRALS